MPTNDWDALRIERGWPTPRHLRLAADAMGVLSHAQYADVLRYVANLCDGVEHAPGTKIEAR